MLKKNGVALPVVSHGQATRTLAAIGLSPRGALGHMGFGLGGPGVLLPLRLDS